MALSERVERDAAWVDANNEGAPRSGEPLVLVRRRELLDREAAIASIAQERAAAYDAYDADSDAYYAKVADLNRQIAHLERGDQIPRATNGAPESAQFGADASAPSSSEEEATSKDAASPLPPPGRDESAKASTDEEGEAKDAETGDAKSDGTEVNDATEDDSADWKNLTSRGDLLYLPEKVGPGELAFAVGPMHQWWERGARATSLGSRLALIPIAYFLYVFFTTMNGDYLTAPDSFAPVGLVSTLANEVVFWLVAAFVLGCLFPYLRGGNGAIKGVVLGGVYAGAHAGASILRVGGDALWQVRSVQLVLFLALLGVWLEADAVEREGLSMRYLVRRYKVDEVRNSIAYGASVVAALIVIQQQFQAGQTEKAISTIVQGQDQWNMVWSAISGL
jgi:hypothetical protein